jgi:hypothetical protein
VEGRPIDGDHDLPDREGLNVGLTLPSCSALSVVSVRHVMVLPPDRQQGRACAGAGSLPMAGVARSLLSTACQPGDSGASASSRRRCRAMPASLPRKSRTSLFDHAPRALRSVSPANNMVATTRETSSPRFCALLTNFPHWQS